MGVSGRQAFESEWDRRMRMAHGKARRSCSRNASRLALSNIFASRNIAVFKFLVGVAEGLSIRYNWEQNHARRDPAPTSRFAAIKRSYTIRYFLYGMQSIGLDE